MRDTFSSHFEPKKFDRVGRRGQKQPKLAYICTSKNTPFWLFLAPPADPVEFLWFKMAGTGIPHIVLHVSSLTQMNRQGLLEGPPVYTVLLNTLLNPSLRARVWMVSGEWRYSFFNFNNILATPIELQILHIPLVSNPFQHTGRNASQ